MSKENNLHDFLTDLADSIREVEGSTDPINPQEFSDRVKAIGTNSGAFGATATLTALIEGSLTEITSNATKVGGRSLGQSNALTSVNLPNATSIAEYAFSNCEALTSVNLPSAETILTWAFYRCYALTSVNLPSAKEFGEGVFNECRVLTSVNLPSINSIPYRTFSSCYSLKKVIIGTNLTTVATLENDNAFENCYHIHGTVNATYNPTGAKDGYIYVPDNLVDSYKKAARWITHASQIKGISELPKE